MPPPATRRPAKLHVEESRIERILTRTGGYLRGVASHSLQPYRGCPLGRSLCGQGCYVQHSWFTTRGRPWGSFLEVRTNAAESYRRTAAAERRWARRRHGEFSIFLSSSTEPFPPQERRFRVTRGVLEAMFDEPPDVLIVQSHSHRVRAKSGSIADCSKRPGCAFTSRSRPTASGCPACRRRRARWPGASTPRGG